MPENHAYFRGFEFLTSKNENSILFDILFIDQLFNKL